MDESFYMHKEDVDLAWRLRQAGFRAAVDGAAVAYHARGTRRAPDLVVWRRLTSVLSVLAAEREKESKIRRLAWRNQLRMLIKNETARGFARSMPWILVQQVGYAAVGMFLDPIGTVADRIRFLLEAPGLLVRRVRRGAGVDLPAWLP
jgi:hypothetical protein